MASFIGNAVEITVMTQAGGTTVDFEFTAYSRDGAIDRSTDSIEAFHYGTTAKQFIAGMTEGTFSFTVDHDDGTLSTSPQKNLEDLGRETRAWRIYPRGAGVGKQSYTFDGFVIASPIALGLGDPVASDVEVQITGAITIAVQS